MKKIFKFRDRIKKMIKISIACLLGFLLAFNVVSEHSVNSTIESNNLNIIDDYKINIEIFYESRCPDSKKFINNQLSKIFESLQNLTSLFLIPYGKAKVR
jgi:hypothetical protein